MKGEACFVWADSEIYHCYLLCAGSTCECESCALIPALQPLYGHSELVLKPSTPASHGRESSSCLGIAVCTAASCSHPGALHYLLVLSI